MLSLVLHLHCVESSAPPTQKWLSTLAPFASLKKQVETLFRLIYCERKTLLRLKKQAEKDEL